MELRLKLVALFAALAAAFTTWPGTASAQSYPTKPVRMVVGFAPGGGTDLMARVIGQKLSEYWGQQIIVENRPGATGVIGAEAIAKSAPDGYNLLMGHVNSNAIAPNLFRKMPYDAAKDFATVMYVGYVPNILAVPPTLPAKSVKELIALAQSKPGKLSFASSGVGSTQHLAGEMFKLLTKVEMVHVPYKGSGQAITDLLAGTVSMNFDTMPPVIEHIKNGRLRALAISTPKRHPQLPDVPTFVESGILGFEVTNWYGMFAPAGTPRDIVLKVNADSNRAMQSPDAKERLQKAGTELGGGTPEEFETFLRAEQAKYAKLIRDAKIPVD